MLSRHLLISRSMLAAVVFCFFLPFITVSCGSSAKSTLSGINMVTGAPIRVDTPYGSEMSGDWFPARSEMIAAFVAGVASLVATFLKISPRMKSTAIAIGSGLAALFFFLLKSAFDNEIRAQSQLILTYEMGFWLSWMLLIATAGLNAWIIYQSMSQRVAFPQRIATHNTMYQSQAPLMPSANETVPSLACPKCGKSVVGTSKFCMHCGEVLVQ
ncbi:MAG: zinc ribbon domain-containing protein [Oscillochloris sp.]|nr:zinc ribbon domain-containing protein [Oscillochloris sp.]